MIGRCGARSRIALESAMAVGNCGPPMTVTPTAVYDSSAMARSAVFTKSRSTLPSMMRVRAHHRVLGAHLALRLLLPRPDALGLLGRPARARVGEGLDHPPARPVQRLV